MTGTTAMSAAARTEVARLRGSGNGSGGASAAELAEALEQLATAATEEGDLGTAAAALEEAAGVWSRIPEPAREGFCLLLAATVQRLRGDLGAARHNLERAAASDLPEAVRRAFEAERAEQSLADGAHEAAYEGFGGVLSVLDAEVDGPVRARILQRRAAAAVAGERWPEAAADLMDARELFAAHGEAEEAEAAALGAALAVARVDPSTAEEVWSAVTASAPRDGAAAAARSITGGRIALLAGDPRLALRRFDTARQGALDATDPISYLAAVAEAVAVAETLGEHVGAYGRLATAWVTVGDLLGAESGRQLVRPLLEELRERLGAERFSAARAAYEARARAGS
ncbi:hypothetical protein ACFXDJ_27860 [Streptomyces sp. NPDC059443]|uniref:hypothetical protein n=1 Tax=unclassified Streptomyces TaxID=2593676 RepID=UPI0036C82793